MRKLLMRSLTAESVMTAVPASYLGVWKRSLLTTDSGHRDTTTLVFWLQTQTLFADLRIPVPVPAEGSRSLQECSEQQLLQLAQQQGFAGVTEVSDDICTWHRELDYQPKSGPPDVGKMVFVTSEFVTEDDPSGENRYHEDWHRLEGSTGKVWGHRLEAVDQPSRKGFLLGAGEYFLFAADRQTKVTSVSSALGHSRAAKAMSVPGLLHRNVNLCKVFLVFSACRSKLQGVSLQHLLALAASLHLQLESMLE
ncbi:TPA: hypothetical protein ACH3X2_000218 [Trebouxia sp. C0005]